MYMNGDAHDQISRTCISVVLHHSMLTLVGGNMLTHEEATNYIRNGIKTALRATKIEDTVHNRYKMALGLRDRWIDDGDFSPMMQQLITSANLEAKRLRSLLPEQYNELRSHKKQVL